MSDRWTDPDPALDLAAFALGQADIGASDAEARQQILAAARLIGGQRAELGELLGAAARAMSALPQPDVDDQSEQAVHIRQMLGGPSAADQVASSLRAREWLEQFAAEADNAS